MDFTYTQDQVSLRDAIHKFLMVEAAPEMLREIWETQSASSDALRAKLAENGLTALSVPEAYGGMGLDDLDWTPIQHELGYYAISDWLTATAYVAAYLLSHLPDATEIKQQWLPKIAAGEARVALGHPLNPFVADAASADLLLLAHHDEVHALAPDQVTLDAQPSIDASRRLYSVRWAPSAATRICDGAAGKKLWAGALNRAGLAISAQLLGLAQRMLDLGTDYAAQRKQFGKPIGSFQAIKHHLADVAVKIEFARPVVQRAAHALRTGSAHADAYVSHARLAAGEAARLAARKSIQVHGAIGYTWEADLQMFMKRTWALDAAWGDAIFHKTRIAAALLDGNVAAGPGHTFD